MSSAAIALCIGRCHSIRMGSTLPLEQGRSCVYTGAWAEATGFFLGAVASLSSRNAYILLILHFQHMWAELSSCKGSSRVSGHRCMVQSHGLLRRGGRLSGRRHPEQRAQGGAQRRWRPRHLDGLWRSSRHRRYART